MSKYKCTITKRGQIGDPSSKYAYDKDGSQFNADMEKHHARAEYLWAEFVAFMKSHEVDPQELRTIFTRYYDEFIKS
ncbi:MAG: hypothetical protein K2M47_00710 [Clostridiales bacterium]|nr:hypothetical protein [Clostridiales bacterium]MDE6200390.1 hypothetical protein [Clostridiales bacterium]